MSSLRKQTATAMSSAENPSASSSFPSSSMMNSSSLHSAMAVCIAANQSASNVGAAPTAAAAGGGGGCASFSTDTKRTVRPWAELAASIPPLKVQRTDAAVPVGLVADDVLDTLARSLMNLGLETGVTRGSAPSDRCGIKGCTFVPMDGYCSVHKALETQVLSKLRDIMQFTKRFTFVKERNTMPDDDIARILGKRPDEIFVDSAYIDKIIDDLETTLPPDRGMEAIQPHLVEVAQHDLKLPNDRYLRADDTIRIVKTFERLEPYGARFPMKTLLIKSTLNLQGLIPHQDFFGHSWCYNSGQGPYIHTDMAPEDVRCTIYHSRGGGVLRPIVSNWSTSGMQGGAAAAGGGGGGGGFCSHCDSYQHDETRCPNYSTALGPDGVGIVFSPTQAQSLATARSTSSAPASAAGFHSAGWAHCPFSTLIPAPPSSPLVVTTDDATASAMGIPMTTGTGNTTTDDEDDGYAMDDDEDDADSIS